MVGLALGGGSCAHPEYGCLVIGLWGLSLMTVALGEALLLGAVAEREGPSSGSCPSLPGEEWLGAWLFWSPPNDFTGWNLRSERYYLLLIQNGRAWGSTCCTRYYKLCAVTCLYSFPFRLWALNLDAWLLLSTVLSRAWSTQHVLIRYLTIWILWKPIICHIKRLWIHWT